MTVICDIVTRMIGRPWLWLQEVTMTFFIYGVFIGMAAATRRNDHLYLAVLAESMSGNERLFFEIFNRLVVLAVAVCMIYYGYLNFLDGFHSLRMPSMTPLAQPLRRDSALRRPGRAVHDRAAGQRLEQRLSPTSTPRRRRRRVAVTTNGMLIFLMAFLFLFLGYMGVPVAFALIAGVLVVTAFTPVGLPR